MPPVTRRLAFIDAMKAVASQLIVLHHLAFYGPMSDVADGLAPELFAWLSQNARIAVQLFLVIAGFLAAKALAPAGLLRTDAPLALLGRRYLKLVIPYTAALLFAILCAAIARQLMSHDSIPNPPTLLQFVAHVFLLQSVLGLDSLSAGVWYIAIDFQLYALLLGTLWLARVAGTKSGKARQLGIMLTGALASASLFYFNRDAGWDNWALYFVGAYGMGALTWWATNEEGRPDWLPIIAGVAILALIVDFRSRIAVALLTALALGIARRWGFMETRPQGALLAWLGKISYAVFLIHFPLILVINGAFARIAPASPAANAFGIVFAWLASIAAGALFYNLVESRAGHILGRRRDGR